MYVHVQRQSKRVGELFSLLKNYKKLHWGFAFKVCTKYSKSSKSHVE